MDNDPNFGYNFKNEPHRTGSKAVADGLGTFFLLKTALLGFRAGKSASDRGASTEEAIVTGATAAVGFQLMIGLTFVYLIQLSSVIARPVLYYFGVEAPTHPAAYMWIVTLGAGGGAIILSTCVWLALYSRLKNKLAGGTRGKLYKWGFRLNRRIFLHFHWLVLGLLLALAPVPLYLLI